MPDEEERICGWCKKPAKGFASIWTTSHGDMPFCHGDDCYEPSCYEMASWRGGMND